MDWFSFVMGVTLASIILVIVMVFLLLWVSTRSYELGWNDRDQGKDIDGK